MPGQEIHIPRKLTNQLLHLAQLSPEAEICGLIGSLDGIPASCYPIANTSEHPEQRYQLEPSQQISAMKTMRESGEELFAIYHSHPKAPAIPSNIDLEFATYPEAYYLIMSLNVKGVLEMRAFQIKDKKSTEVVILLSEN